MPTVQERYAEALMNAFGTPRLVLASGSGAIVRDEDGREYLDLLGGIAVNTLGHAHPALVEAVTGQLATLGHVSNFFATEPQVRLAERLLDLLAVPAGTGTGTGKVFFANSGAEANEAALKLTRLTGRTEVIAAEGAFHGRTLGSLALTAKAAYRDPFEPLPGGVTFVPYGDADALAEAVSPRTAAVVLEPVQGEAGVVVPPRDYLPRAREITAATGTLLWLDEIQTGTGRTGTWFAFQNEALTEPLGAPPDIVTLAKGLAGGLPVGACLATGTAADLFQPGNHGTTFGGNPVAAAAGLAVLDVLVRDRLLANATARGAQLRDGVARDPRVTDVRGAGLLIGLDLAEPKAAEVVTAALAEGFLLNNPTPERVRLAPPLVLAEEQAARFLAAWPRILDRAWEAAP